MTAFHKNTSLKQLIGTNTIRSNQNFVTPTETKTTQVNVPHVTTVDRYAANKFSKQQHLQALKPLQFFTKPLAIITVSSTY